MSRPKPPMDTVESLALELAGLQAQVASVAARLARLEAQGTSPRAPHPAGHQVSLQGPRGALAQAVMLADGLLVLEGSLVSHTVVPSMPQALQGARQALLDAQVIERTGKMLRFSRHHLFASVSTAAAVVMGRNANGWREWRDTLGRPLAEVVKGAGP